MLDGHSLIAHHHTFKATCYAATRPGRMLRGKMSPNCFEAPAKLPQLVQSKFNNAKANGDINFYPTQVAVLKPGSVPVRSSSRRSSPSLYYAI